MVLSNSVHICKSIEKNQNFLFCHVSDSYCDDNLYFIYISFELLFVCDKIFLMTFTSNYFCYLLK
jgi:hypothetical protein